MPKLDAVLKEKHHGMKLRKGAQKRKDTDARFEMVKSLSRIETILTGAKPKSSPKPEKIDGKNDEKIDGRINEKIDGKMYEKIDGKIYEKIDGKIDEKIHGSTDEKINGKIDVYFLNTFNERERNSMRKSRAKLVRKSMV